MATVEREYPTFATCDGCAHHAAVRLQTADDGNSPYVCRECDRQFDRAVDAAAVVLALHLGHTLASVSPPEPAPNTRRIALAVIEAFIDADWIESARRNESVGGDFSTTEGSD